MKDFRFLCPLIIKTSPLSAAKKYSRGNFFFGGQLQNEALSPGLASKNDFRASRCWLQKCKLYN